jgi:hypothetical protein
MEINSKARKKRESGFPTKSTSKTVDNLRISHEIGEESGKFKGFSTEVFHSINKKACGKVVGLL